MKFIVVHSQFESYIPLQPLQIFTIIKWRLQENHKMPHTLYVFLSTFFLLFFSLHWSNQFDYPKHNIIRVTQLYIYIYRSNPQNAPTSNTFIYKISFRGLCLFQTSGRGFTTPFQASRGRLTTPLLPVPTSSLSQMSICMLSLHRVAITIRIIIRFHTS